MYTLKRVCVEYVSVWEHDMRARQEVSSAVYRVTATGLVSSWLSSWTERSNRRLQINGRGHLLGALLTHSGPFAVSTQVVPLVQRCTQTHTHTHTHTHTQARTNTYIHASTHTHGHTRRHAPLTQKACTYTQACTHTHGCAHTTHTRTHTHEHTHARAHARTHKHTHTLTHTHTHTHTHKHTHTHTHIHTRAHARWDRDREKDRDRQTDRQTERVYTCTYTIGTWRQRGHRLRPVNLKRQSSWGQHLLERGSFYFLRSNVKCNLHTQCNIWEHFQHRSVPTP